MNPFMTKPNAVTLVAAFSLVTCMVAASVNAQALTAPTPLTSATATPVLAYVSIGEKPAILYDAPSAKANRTHILFRFQPVEVLVKLDKWTKVRDADGAIGWIENSACGDKRLVLVSTANAEVRAMPTVTAALVFEAQRGVVVETTGNARDGWLPVRHRDGQAGFVRVTQVWGG